MLLNQHIAQEFVTLVFSGAANDTSAPQCCDSPHDCRNLPEGIKYRVCAYVTGSICLRIQSHRYAPARDVDTVSCDIDDSKGPRFKTSLGTITQ